jgi:hypothetical protein
MRTSTLLEPLNMLSGSPASASLLLCRYTDLEVKAWSSPHLGSPSPWTTSWGAFKPLLRLGLGLKMLSSHLNPRVQSLKTSDL